MKEGFTKIKMARRLAERILGEGYAHVRLSTQFGDYTTGELIINGLVYIIELAKHVPIEEIKEIEYTDRFGLTKYWEVDWE